MHLFLYVPSNLTIIKSSKLSKLFNTYYMIPTILPCISICEFVKHEYLR